MFDSVPFDVWVLLAFVATCFAAAGVSQWFSRR